VPRQGLYPGGSKQALGQPGDAGGISEWAAGGDRLPCGKRLC